MSAILSATVEKRGKHDPRQQPGDAVGKVDEAVRLVHTDKWDEAGRLVYDLKIRHSWFCAGNGCTQVATVVLFWR